MSGSDRSPIRGRTIEEPCEDAMDCKRFDWPEVAGEPDDAWFGYLADRGWTVSPVPTLGLVGERRYRRYLGWRSPQPA